MERRKKEDRRGNGKRKEGRRNGMRERKEKPGKYSPQKVYLFPSLLKVVPVKCHLDLQMVYVGRAYMLILFEHIHPEGMTDMPLWEFGIRIKSSSNLPCDTPIPEPQVSAGN